MDSLHFITIDHRGESQDWVIYFFNLKSLKNKQNYCLKLHLFKVVHTVPPIVFFVRIVCNTLLHLLYLKYRTIISNLITIFNVTLTIL